MPKGKKKGKESRREREASSDEESLDNYSEHSAQSDVRSTHDDAEEEAEGGDAGQLESKVCECVEQLGAKAAATRAAAFTSLRTGLERKYLAPVLSGHRATLAEHVSRTLRKGRTPERRAAANVATLLAVQVGEEGGEEFLSEVRPALLAVALDSTADLDLRAECCSALAALCLLLEEDVGIVLDLLVAMETIFSGSYLKGDGSVKVSGPAVAAGGLHAAALDAWALLLPLAGAAGAAAGGVRGARLAQLLEAYSLEVRMAAGMALAVAHETLCEQDGSMLEEVVAEALPLLTQLASDSNKHRAKRDRKAQRATFRDILKYLQDGDMEPVSVVLGRESLTLDTWAARGAYGALAGALGGGLRACAPYHAALRAALGLPDAPPPPRHPLDLRHDKLQRQLQNAAAFKARTISRGKNRDKRSALLAL